MLTHPLAYSILSDLVCSLLPIVVLWNVKVSRHLKWAVCGLMSVGLLYTNVSTIQGRALIRSQGRRGALLSGLRCQGTTSRKILPVSLRLIGLGLARRFSTDATM